MPKFNAGGWLTPEVRPTADVIFCITKNDVMQCAERLGISKEAITDDVLEQVKDGVSWGLECWSEVVEEALNMALKG